MISYPDDYQIQWWGILNRNSTKCQKGGNEMSVINLTQQNFNQEVLQSETPVLVDFWAEWCGPCRMVSPIVEEIACENTNFKVGKVNVDDQQALAQQYGVRSIPTLIVFKKGSIYKTAVGARPKESILQMIE